MIQIYVIIRRLLYKLTFYTVFAAIAAISGTQFTTAAEVPAAGALFRLIEERFGDITAMSYSVKRSMVTNKLTAEDRWVFRFKKPDYVRIDYQAPHERVIIIDSTTLWEYIPELKKAAKTDLSGMPKEKRNKIIAEVMSHIAVDGLHLGNYGEMEKRALPVRTVTWAGKDIYLVEGTAPRYAVYIDKEKSAILRTEIYDQKGSLTLRTAGSRYIEAAKGLWMPQEIRATYRAPSGFVQTTINLNEIRVDSPIADDVFRFRVPKGIEVILN